MRPATFIPAILGLLAGTAAAVGESFTTSTDATGDGGFTIPENTPAGLYKVTIDGDGVAHHIKIEAAAATAAKVSATMSRALRKRQLDPLWIFTCPGGAELNHADADATFNSVRNMCSGEPRVPGGTHIYAVQGSVATYWCNFSGGDNVCKGWEVAQIIQVEVSGRCGRWRPGWGLWDGQVSIGYQNVGGDRSFCNRGH